MTDLSERYLKKHCLHCDPDSFTLNSRNRIEETQRFWVVFDPHPLLEGHILLIPKKHLSCIGAYPEDIYDEFQNLYKKYSERLQKPYGNIATFEHGIAGQTVFHSHTHLLPYSGEIKDIIPEGPDNFREITDLSALKGIFKKNGKYLFLSIGQKKWTVNLALSTPGFFKERFAGALGRPERADWKKMHSDLKLMQEAEKEISAAANKLRK